jgi:bile acid:Na+ symporter, BASS family
MISPMENAIDQVMLNFSPQGLLALNIILGLILFGIALDIHVDDFRRVAREPKGPLIALACQILLVPAIAYVLIWVLDPLPSIALGMILVAACPSGNISNYLTHLAKGNTALSISATALSTALAIIVTPFNLAFWASLHPKTQPLLRQIVLEPADVFSTIVLVLGLPLALGMLTAARAPQLAARLLTPIRRISLIFFVAFVVLALRANWEHFVAYIGLALLAVFLENAFAILGGYGVAKLARLPEADVRAVAIEVGIHNTGLGLILVFNFFDGNGGMALVAAWWGIWHIFAGGILAAYWRRKPIAEATPPVLA